MKWPLDWSPADVTQCARWCARLFAEEYDLDPAKRPKIGIVLGTGWSDSIHPLYQPVPLVTLPGFGQLGELAGHHRSLAIAEISGTLVVVQYGRVHMNEHPTDPAVPAMVRLQVEVMHALGLRTLVLTNACGSLDDAVMKPGTILLIDGFEPRGPSPLVAGEFCNPEDTIMSELHDELEERLRSDGNVLRGGYVYNRGPAFEGRKREKENLAGFTGCLGVGMSTYPEAAICSLRGMRTVPVSCVSNTAKDEHSHEANVALLKSQAQRLGNALTHIVEVLR